MSVKGKELKSVLGFSILHTGRLMVNKINKHFASIGTDITMEQMKVLFFIWISEDEVMIQQDVAEIMNKSKSAILRTIDILEKKNYVTRKPFDNDRRKHVLSTTEEGKKIAEHALQIFKDQEKLITSTIPTEDIKVCMRVLQAIQDNCEEDKCFE